MPSLQALFIQSKGKPIQVDGDTVTGIDKINIARGAVIVRFLHRSGAHLQGVALKSAKGYVRLSDGSEEKRVNIWDEPGLPRTIKHEVFCPNGELLLWNIYKATNIEERTQSDYWTNNAGMIIETVTDHCRRYRCSDGIGSFMPDDLVFEIEWIEHEATGHF
jgi:hypothetical protein